MAAKRKINYLPENQFIKQNYNIPNIIQAVSLTKNENETGTGKTSDYSYLQLLELAKYYVNLNNEKFPFLICSLLYFEWDSVSPKAMLRNG